jgi:hypothetical protein
MASVMAPVTLECPANLEKLREREWQAAVVQAAALYGWMCEHVRAMQYNDAGLPDLLCFRGEEHRLLELKTMHARSKLRASQERWIERARAFGVAVYVLKPCRDDWKTMLEVLR